MWITWKETSKIIALHREVYIYVDYLEYMHTASLVRRNGLISAQVTTPLGEGLM